MYAINKKNKKRYELIKPITNTTNAQDGQLMFLYEDENGESFVREINEFQDKFDIKISSDDIMPKKLIDMLINETKKRYEENPAKKNSLDEMIKFFETAPLEEITELLKSRGVEFVPNIRKD